MIWINVLAFVCASLEEAREHLGRIMGVILEKPWRWKFYGNSKEEFWVILLFVCLAGICWHHYDVAFIHSLVLYLSPFIEASRAERNWPSPLFFHFPICVYKKGLP